MTPQLNGYYVDRGEYMVRAFPGHTNIAVCINYEKFAETAGIGGGAEYLPVSRSRRDHAKGFNERISNSPSQEERVNLGRAFSSDVKRFLQCFFIFIIDKRHLLC